MNVKSILAAGLGAFALAAIASAAEAAPAGGLAAAIDRDATSAIEQVTWKRHRHWHCHWYRGHRHCWWGYRHYGWRHHHRHYRYW